MPGCAPQQQSPALCHVSHVSSRGRAPASFRLLPSAYAAAPRPGQPARRLRNPSIPDSRRSVRSARPAPAPRRSHDRPPPRAAAPSQRASLTCSCTRALKPYRPRAPELSTRACTPRGGLVRRAPERGSRRAALCGPLSTRAARRPCSPASRAAAGCSWGCST